MPDYDATAAFPDPSEEPTILVRPAGERLEPGMVLRNRFVLEKLLGQGGMGKVFLALDRDADSTNPYVAIKVLSEDFRQHPQALTVLRREGTNARQLNHPNIVAVYDFVLDDAHPFMVMEYMRGQSLDRFVQAHPTGLDYKKAWPIIRGCASALHYMHTHSPCIVHSDFKPGNVFLTDNRETKILDLGIARTIDATMAGTTGTRFKARNPVLALTPEYASCEMFEGRSPDPRDDLYALGCVAYELLTGQHPFDREYAIDARQRQRRPARPKHLRTRAWRALQAALAFDRLDRIASAEEFLTEFGPPESKASARPWILASVGLLAVLAGAGLWIYELRPGPEDQFLEDRLGVETQGDATADDAAFYMEQGDTFLSIAQDKLSGEDPVGALYFLGGATSSAERSFAFVLEHAADDEVRRAAASGLLRVSDAYATAAETLKNNNKIAESLQFVCHGMRLNRYEPRFAAWYKELDSMRPRGSRIEACEGL